MAEKPRKGEAIIAFLGENPDLFPRCPFRREFARLDQRPDKDANAIVAHMLGHILDFRAGTPQKDVVSGTTVQAIDQSGIEREVRGISRIVYDVTRKPRDTIEWEWGHLTPAR